MAFVGVLSVPLLGGVRGGFVVPMRMRKSEERLSVNLSGHPIAACFGTAALKTQALQRLTRGPLTLP